MDMKETIGAISKCSALPLSIVIVGIGNANFQKMVVLDGDDVKISKRDIV